MVDTPVAREVVDRVIARNHLSAVGRAAIRELGKVVDEIEEESGIGFIRMEMGIPGLPACQVGIEAEVEALRSGIVSQYPNIQGLPRLKEAASRFLKVYLDIDVKPQGCLPSTGSTNGSFLSFMVAGRRCSGRETVLFLDPGFPVHKLQVRALGLKQRSIDVYEHRGDRLRSALEPLLDGGEVSVLLYSNPNNPTWICFTESELKTIGELCEAYDVVALEDLAYFGMDFRQDYSVPGHPPFPPTVAKYTERFILLVSSSKLFSYAGQRIGLLAVSDSLFETRWPDLKRYFTTDRLGHALIFGAAYAVSAGVNSSSQFGLAAILEKTAEGEVPLLEPVKIYGRRAAAMKSLFLSQGFRIVYDLDVDQPIGDGFYFTVSYPGFSGEELVAELLYYGISAISLATTGSERLEGIRACVSRIEDSAIPILKERLERFHQDHRL